MTNEQAIEYLEMLSSEVYNEDSNGYECAKAIDVAIKALEANSKVDKQTNEQSDFGCSEKPNRSDVIKRQDAIMHFVKASKNYECGMFDLREVTHELWKLPSAQPEQGDWIQISPAKIYECSECGQNVMTDDIDAYKWCHGCGARMSGGQE